MTQQADVLLLAGSAEARQIAQALQGLGHRVHALLSEPPRGANPMPVPFEVCAEVTEDRVAQAMAGVSAVIDASHGFDAALTHAGYAAAIRLVRPFISLSRPTWDLGENPNWVSAATVRAAMTLIAPGARVFSATGWASLPECAAFPGACLMLRQTVPHDRPAPYDFVELVFGDPPFTVETEVALFKARKVDTLIARNLGGKPSRPKLDAAAALGLRVILIDRPPLPPGLKVVSSVQDALDWVAQL
ncbi:Precorrin-6A reductase [Sulfitobacter noctilucae]|uniref:precorrin-6A/cobalt-precorrin-6A reductase n=1 Tax=Sulfitobacter noctilucae TaxID=1342302 RepID=UPI0004683ADF|nr:precorrin-6A/cobalt-precorrin-6A reductase [Sulfitobacter noctilucae]KIN61294.1 Precorrin-6A reductase [Sulfitobacter noctilucae]